MADGIYSNLAIITHSNSEFVLDFVRVMPGVPKAKVRARVLLTPQHAKRLMRALTDNIQKFEAVHGNIHESEMPEIPMNFGGPLPRRLDRKHVEQKALQIGGLFSFVLLIPAYQ